MSRVCVIGAGSSGIAACQAVHARGIPFDCFEAGSSVGGNWRYDNDSGMSSAYRSLHANSSRRGMQYASFTMPDSYPDYLSHEMIVRYLDDFVDHFGFRAKIQFQTEVTRAGPGTAGGWDVTVRQRDTGEVRTRPYSSVLVATGHHWDPRYPQPAIPGAGAFTGEQIHSHYYRTPERFTGKRVLILGIGNSACDIAADCSQVAARTVLAMRRGAHIVPRYLFGVPTDHLTLMRLGTRAPLWLQRSTATSPVSAPRDPAALPPEPEMNHEIAQNHAATARRYGRCAGHAVRVDFLAYLREIGKERRAGARHSRAWRAIPADPPDRSTGQPNPLRCHVIGA